MSSMANNHPDYFIVKLGLDTSRIDTSRCFHHTLGILQGYFELVVGTMDAKGYSVNIPWSCGGVGDNDYIFAFQHVVLPIALEFAPDITIISAGFDAARGDPLGCCDLVVVLFFNLIVATLQLTIFKSSYSYDLYNRQEIDDYHKAMGMVGSKSMLLHLFLSFEYFWSQVTPAGYAQMAHMLTGLSQGKLLVILEGGYNLRSISSSATAVVKVLLGEDPGYDMSNVVPSKTSLYTILQVLKIQLKYEAHGAQTVEKKCGKEEEGIGRIRGPEEAKG
ncbi:hypothetical protein COCNU_06G018060 [Cocos nucifera]|uniref:histone deacetylase n=1 Tax=Cocos nucifera TaxID=13894 RepID=A0A8K0N4C9_COCNU|nr:hypothetical protein COCNU_06G018060 [Cocos nucifera]